MSEQENIGPDPEEELASVEEPEERGEAMQDDVADEEDVRDRLDALEGEVAEVQKLAASAAAHPPDDMDQFFIANVKTDGTFNELCVVNGTLSTYIDGRQNDTTNTLTQLTGSQSLVLEYEDYDAAGNPKLSFVQVGGSQSSTSGSKLLYARTSSGYDTVAATGSIYSAATNLDLKQGDVLRVRAGGTFSNPVPGPTVSPTLILYVNSTNAMRVVLISQLQDNGGSEPFDASFEVTVGSGNTLKCVASVISYAATLTTNGPAAGANVQSETIPQYAGANFTNNTGTCGLNIETGVMLVSYFTVERIRP